MKRLWPKFNDNNTKSLWKHIVRGMKEIGYLIPSTEQWKMCSQNLIKAHKKCLMSETESGADVLENKPAFYNVIQ